MILEKLKEVGEIAVPGGFAGSGDLIRMANLEDLRAELDVNEIRSRARCSWASPRRSCPTRIPIAATPRSVVKLYPQVNRQKGTLKVEVGIPEPDEWLRPDMSVRITFLAGEPPRARASAAPQVLAPREAMRRDERGELRLGGHRGPPAAPADHDAGAAADRARWSASGLAGGEALVVGDPGVSAEGQRVRRERPASASAGLATTAVFDTVVVGAGVVGLAIARAEALRGREVVILEREPRFGTATSSRNSEVIHAGHLQPDRHLDPSSVSRAAPALPLLRGARPRPPLHREAARSDRRGRARALAA